MQSLYKVAATFGGRRTTATLTAANKTLLEVHKQEALRIDQLRGFSLPRFSAGDMIKFEMPQTMSPDETRKCDVIEGLVIARRNRGHDSTFTVRSIVDGLGCEQTVPVYSPWIRNFQVTKRQRTRRAKLYYMRQRPNSLEI